MALADGLIGVCVIIGSGSVAMVGLAMWLLNRDSNNQKKRSRCSLYMCEFGTRTQIRTPDDRHPMSRVAAN